MRKFSIRLRGLLIALVALAMSAGLTFGAQPPAAAESGLANAASHAGKTVPVAGGEVETTGDEETEEGDEDAEPGDEGTEEGDEDAEAGDEGSEEAGDNCLTDPTTLTPEELAVAKHGSVVCWAAQQETWPEEFKNHGAWVSSWAKSGKDADEDAAGAAKAKAPKSHGKGNSKGKGHQG